MLPFGHGTPGMPLRPPRIRWWWSVPIVVGFGLFAWEALAGCSAVPERPLEARWAVVCEAVGRAPGCVLKPRKVGAVTLRLTETDFTVEIAGQVIGTWPIDNPVPIDPATLTPDVVDRLVKYQTGGPATQAALRALWRLAPSEVAYLDDATKLENAGSGLATLEATVAVVRR